MIVTPKFRGLLCLVSHPTGCKKMVEKQMEYVLKQEKIQGGKNVLILGSSMGYGLASRIASAGGGANTLGVMFDKVPSEGKPGTPGYYNDKALKQLCQKKGLYYKTLNGDVFGKEMKEHVADAIRNDLGKIDLLIYSIATPKRTLGGVTYRSVLKTIGEPFPTKNLDYQTGVVSPITVPAATPEEIEATVKVMGGDDWFEWVQFLKNENLLDQGFRTVSYSYVGPRFIYPIYREGTIGRAKEHLEKVALKIDHMLKDINGRGIVAVCKAIVTQAAMAIPGVSLYIAILYKYMKEEGTHEGCIEQIVRLYRDHLFSPAPVSPIRIDDYELDKDLEEKVTKIFDLTDTENLKEHADLEGVRRDLLNVYGFGMDGVNYQEDVDIS